MAIPSLAHFSFSKICISWLTHPVQMIQTILPMWLTTKTKNLSHKANFGALTGHRLNDGLSDNKRDKITPIGVCNINDRLGDLCL